MKGLNSVVKAGDSSTVTDNEGKFTSPPCLPASLDSVQISASTPYALIGPKIEFSVTPLAPSSGTFASAPNP